MEREHERTARSGSASSSEDDTESLGCEEKIEMKVAYGSDSNSDIDRYVNEKISEEYDPELSSRNSDDYYNEYYN